MFPAPLRIDFEGFIFKRYCILSKKRYLYLSSDREGKIESKIGRKGVLLSRRDNSPFIRNIYEGVIKRLFNAKTEDEKLKNEIIQFVLEELNNMFQNTVVPKDFVITKSIGSVNNLNVEEFTNTKNIKKGKVGDYTVPLLLEGEERQKQLLKKNAVDEEDFYRKSLPSQVQLGLKMESRGQIVQSGSRLEYVMIESENINDKASEKVESFDYFAKHKDVLKIDFLYYTKLLINPMDEVFGIVFKEKEFTMKQYKTRVQKAKMLDELRSLFAPKVEYIDETCEEVI
jgi:DNA polymerase elongation subunit (family B)